MHNFKYTKVRKIHTWNGESSWLCGCGWNGRRDLDF